MRDRTTTGNVALEYLKKHPDKPSRTLARMMFEREKPLYTSVEQARSAIRMMRGQSGTKNRTETKERTHYKEAGTVTDGLERLPEPLCDGSALWKVHRFGGFKRALMISDVHVPYHDIDALKMALRHGKKLEADAVILNGDLCDFYSISFWDKDPRSHASERSVCRAAGAIADTLWRLGFRRILT
jgi:hypothetical protein